MSLTPAGRRLFHRLWAESDRLRTRLVAALRPDVATLATLLHRVAGAMAPPAHDGRRKTLAQGANR